MIAFTILFYDKAIVSSGQYTLILCAGTALLLLSSDAKRLGLIFKNKISVGIGQLSYSLYLVHWPVIVFYKHSTFRNYISFKTGVFLLMISLMLALVCFYFVEKPFRNNGKIIGNYALRWEWCLVPILLVSASLMVLQKDGWPTRYPAGVIEAIGDLQKRQADRHKYTAGDDSVSKSPFSSTSKFNVLVIGDSHSVDFFNSLYYLLKDQPSVSIRRTTMDDTCLHFFANLADSGEDKNDNCKAMSSNFRSSALTYNADKIIYSTRWEKKSIPFLENFSNYIERHTSAELVITGRTAEFANVPLQVSKIGLVKDLDLRIAKSRVLKIDETNVALKLKSEELDLDYIEKIDLICNKEKTSCDVLDSSGKLLYTDYGHWSVEGAVHFGKKMLSSISFIDSVFDRSVCFQEVPCKYKLGTHRSN